MEENSSNTIVESRQELMVSSTGQGNPILRTAHFLKPSARSNIEEGCRLSSLSLQYLPPTLNPQKRPLTVNFHGWRNPPKKWNEWVEKMVSLHEPTWRKAGIHEAILNSMYQSHKNSDLVIGIAERWCPNTNSFIFPWGEATVTLEDMLISGYSVLGCPVFKALETEELKAIQEKLIQARSELVKSSSKKASQYAWLRMFMNSGNKLEHEAFISLWISRFVLPTSFDVISDSIFPIAIHLSRGTRIALAPAVLATIYRDFSLLKEKIVSLAANSDNDGENNESKLTVSVFSPFQLVQVWIWERFIKLRPKPVLIITGEPRLARWNNLKCKFKNLRQILDSSKESFVWRPYTKSLGDWNFPKFYGEKEMWVSLSSGLDEELESFIRCLIASELVGIGADCIEQYLPHRVARQFGMDQDVPGFIARSNNSWETAWSCYSRPFTNVKCYIPSRVSETEITSQYFECWKRSVLDLQSVVQWQEGLTCPGNEPRSLKEQHKMQKFVSGSKIRRKVLKGKKAVTMKNKSVSNFRLTSKSAMMKERGDDTIVPAFYYNDCVKGSPQVLKRKNAFDVLLASNHVGKKLKTLVESSTEKEKEKDRTASLECSSDSAKAMDQINELLVHPGFRPKSNRTEIENSSEEDNLPIAQIIRYRKEHDVESRQCGNGKNLQGKPQCHSSLAANEAAPKTSVFATSVQRVVPRVAAGIGLDNDNQSACGQYVSDLLSNKAASEDEQSSNGETASGPSVIHSSSSQDNEDQTVLDPTSVGNLTFDEASETKQDGDGENASQEPGQSQSRSLSTTIEGAILNLLALMDGAKHDATAEKEGSSGENAPSLSGQHHSHSNPVAAENTKRTETGGWKVEAVRANKSSRGSQAHKNGSSSRLKEGISDYAFEASVLKLEDEITRLEKIVAERKAVLSNSRRLIVEPCYPP